MSERGITLAAAKYVYKKIVEQNKSGTAKSPLEIVEEEGLWLADEWTHLGHCIITCLDNPKLIDSYKKGNQKVADALLGKTIKNANMTVDAEIIKELLPLVIAAHF